MTTDESTGTARVERLAEALAELAETQKQYQNELDQERQRHDRLKSELPDYGRAFDHPSRHLQSFYSRACSGTDQYHIGEYASLCKALAEVRHVLAFHPVLAEVVDPFSDRDEFSIQILDHGGSRSLLDLIGGLMARGMEVPKDGFRVAATELHKLLDPEGDSERPPGSGDLSVGYHVAILYGLRVREEVQLADGMALLPFEQLGAFVNESLLQEVAEAVIRHNGQQSVGALVQSFCWKPEFRKLDDNSVIRPSGGQLFSTAALDFVELLALFHAAPVLCLAAIPYRIHRTASYLLGDSPYNCNWISTRSFGLLDDSTELRAAALDEASNAFRDRKSANYQHCAPIIGRLAEALARGGRFRTDDKILDVAIALERIYELDRGAISRTLRRRAAGFLETSPENRSRVAQDVQQFYNMRSAIIHRREPQNQPSEEEKRAVFDKGFEVARRSVVKMLRDGPPDWDTVAMAETGPNAPEPDSGEGTA